MPEKQIDALIEAGWHVLESDFDEAAFLRWRMRAYECLKVLLGPRHTYTEHFEYNMRQSEATTLLSGVGVLAAVSLGGLHESYAGKRMATMEPRRVDAHDPVASKPTSGQPN